MCQLCYFWCTITNWYFNRRHLCKNLPQKNKQGYNHVIEPFFPIFSDRFPLANLLERFFRHQHRYRAKRHLTLLVLFPVLWYPFQINSNSGITNIKSTDWSKGCRNGFCFKVSRNVCQMLEFSRKQLFLQQNNGHTKPSSILKSGRIVVSHATSSLSLYQAARLARDCQ